MMQNTGPLAVLQATNSLAGLDFPTVTNVSGLYLHAPFCVHKCGYCDFYSITSHEDRQPAWADAVIAELDFFRDHFSLDLETLYVGGGTPTLLPVELWTQLLAQLNNRCDLASISECSIEANPETVSAELMDVLVEGGFNRVSIGCQSFDPDLLTVLERSHDPASVKRAIQLARSAGIRNVSLDLIYAIPGQTIEQLESDLDQLIDLNPDHLSCYSLIFEPGTALTAKRDLGRISAINNDLEAQMFNLVIDRLASAGYEHYEVSNWAKPGRACQHNLAYWTNRNWVGIGPSAASHVGGLRWKNAPHLGRYLASPGNPPVLDVERLNQDASVGEEIMLRLRLLEGIRDDWLATHVPQDSTRFATIERYVSQGLLEHQNARLSLSRRGLMVADMLLSELL